MFGLKTDKYDIIIEAKKHDSSVLQNKDQWKKELKALCNERLEDTNKKILFIALGGNESLYNDTVEVNAQSYIAGNFFDFCKNNDIVDWKNVLIRY